MKSVFFSKTLLWRITFTFVTLLAVAGIIRLNQSFESMETKEISKTLSPQETVENLIRDQQEKTSGQKNLILTEPQKGEEAEGKPGTGNQPPPAKRSQFFVEYRMQRDRARGQQIDLLREIVDNVNSSEDVRKEAQRRLLQISQLMEKEMEIENMIRAKNFKDAVVFLQEKTATVIVQAKSLNEDEEQKIRGIINRTSGIEEAEVVVIPKE